MSEQEKQHQSQEPKPQPKPDDEGYQGGDGGTQPPIPPDRPPH